MNFLSSESSLSDDETWKHNFKEVTNFIKNSGLNYKELVGASVDKFYSQLPETSLSSR